MLSQAKVPATQSNAQSIVVCVYAYDKFLIIAPVAGKTDCLSPRTGFGYLLPDTKNHLGVSEEALQLMKQVRKGNALVGDIDWYKDETWYTFGWAYPANRILDSTRSETCRNFKVVKDACVVVPNNVSDKMLAAIENHQISW